MDKTMKYDIINLMKNLKESSNSKSLKDVFYLNSIDYTETINGISFPAKKDIFIVAEEKFGITSYKFYDENEQLLAVDLGNGQGIMATGDFFKGRDLDFTKDILDDITNFSPKVSLNEINLQLEEYAKALGISKDKILSAVNIDLDNELDMSPEIKNDRLESVTEKDKIKLDDKETDNNTLKENNKTALEHISTKEEVDVDKTVTGKETLAKILKVPSGCKLVSVYSENVADNHNTAEFSFLIKYPDGTLKEAEMLKQVEGNLPDKEISSINRDGSEVTQKHVNSMFSIESTSDSQDMLTITRGSHGTLDLDYTIIDPTDNNRGLSIPLETDHIQPITSEVRNEMNYTKDDRNITDNLNEGKQAQEDCEKADCDQELTLDDFDGDPDTGHHHIDEQDPQLDIYVNKILENGIVNDNYYYKEVKEAFIEATQKHPDWSLDKVKEWVEYDLEVSAPIQERY